MTPENLICIASGMALLWAAQGITAETYDPTACTLAGLSRLHLALKGA